MKERNGKKAGAEWALAVSPLKVVAKDFHSLSEIFPTAKAPANPFGSN
jgi:hypothetical protein